MTKRQIRVCRIMRKYRYLKPILQKSRISDYTELQECLGDGVIPFSDIEISERTEVILDSHVLAHLEEYQRQVTDTWITRGLSICALIVSVIALFRS